jgi:hypothetical protein
VHPYRTPFEPPRREAVAHEPSFVRVTIATLFVLGGIRVVVGVAVGRPLAGLAPLAMSMVAVASVLASARAWRRARRRLRRRRILHDRRDR